MIDYRIDLTKPYLVVEQDETHIIAVGTSKVLQTSDGEFGGTEGVWCFPKHRLLTDGEKKTLRLIRKTQGPGARQRREAEMLSTVIAAHSNNSTGA